MESWVATCAFGLRTAVTDAPILDFGLSFGRFNPAPMDVRQTICSGVAECLVDLQCGLPRPTAYPTIPSKVEELSQIQIRFFSKNVAN